MAVCWSQPSTASAGALDAVRPLGVATATVVTVSETGVLKPSQRNRTCASTLRAFSVVKEWLVVECVEPEIVAHPPPLGQSSPVILWRNWYSASVLVVAVCWFHERSISPGPMPAVASKPVGTGTTSVVTETLAAVDAPTALLQTKRNSKSYDTPPSNGTTVCDVVE